MSWLSDLNLTWPIKSAKRHLQVAGSPDGASSPDASGADPDSFPSPCAVEGGWSGAMQHLSPSVPSTGSTPTTRRQAPSIEVSAFRTCSPVDVSVDFSDATVDSSSRSSLSYLSLPPSPPLVPSPPSSPLLSSSSSRSGRESSSITRSVNSPITTRDGSEVAAICEPPSRAASSCACFVIVPSPQESSVLAKSLFHITQMGFPGGLRTARSNHR